MEMHRLNLLKVRRFCVHRNTIRGCNYPNCEGNCMGRKVSGKVSERVRGTKGRFIGSKPFVSSLQDNQSTS